MPRTGPVCSKVAVTPSYSIISLLLRLHSKLSGKPDSYEPTTSFGSPEQAAHGPFLSDPEGRIGSGPFFIKKVNESELACLRSETLESYF